MKKVILSIVLLSCLLPGVFATGLVGLSAYPEFGWFSTSINNEGDYLTTTIDTSLFIEGANYFGDRHSYGIGYGLGVGFHLLTTDDSLVNSDNTISLIPKLSFQYKFDIDERSSIEAGAGIQCAYKSNDYFEQKMVSIYANTNYAFCFGGSFAFRAGLELATPIYTSIQVLKEDYKELWKLENYGIILKPYVGASFCY